MYNYKAVVTRVVDGDTVIARVDLGFHIFITETFRLLHINAPEIVGVDKVKGLAAKTYLENLVLNKECHIATAKSDGFRRWLADINILNTDGARTNISDAMLKSGHAVRYENKK